MRKAQDCNQPCPNGDCEKYGRKNGGNIASAGTYMTRSGKRRIFRCDECGETFSETRDTVFYDLGTSEEKVATGPKMILACAGLSGMSFVPGFREETVPMWLDRASRKARETNRILPAELPVTEVRSDETWAFVKRKVYNFARPHNEPP